MTDLVADISQFADGSGAVYVGKRSLSSLTLKRFEETVGLSIGQWIPLSKKPFAVKLAGIGFEPQSQRFTPRLIERELPSPQAHEFYLTGPEKIFLRFVLGIRKSKSIDELTELVVELDQFRFHIFANKLDLIMSGQPSEIDVDLNRLADFDQNVRKHKIEADDVTRIEGMLQFGGLETIVVQTLPGSAKIDLDQLFPGVVFSGRMELKLSSDKEFLLLRGANGISRTSSDSCLEIGLENSIGDLDVGAVKVIAQAPSSKGDPVAGSISLGGPRAVGNINQIVGQRSRGIGDAGLFMSKEWALEIAEGVFPAVRVDLNDNGFVGWSAVGIVDFSNFSFELDPTRGAFFIELEFRAEIYGSAHLDFGKLGKIRFASFDARQNGPGSNKVRIGCYFVVGTKEAYFKPVLEEVQVGKYDVYLPLVSVAASPFGTKAQIAAFVMDKILATLIAHHIPYKIREELYQFMAGKVMPVLDWKLAHALNGENTLNRFPRALFDGTETGLLLSTVGDPG